MYIEKIHNFLPKYENISRERYMNILKWANTLKFDEFKMEKDFLLTLILLRFWEMFPDLVFKWGTCLNKIYFPYFRLSEDLDFVVSQYLWRSARQKLLKKYEDEIRQELRKLWLTQREERTKYDEHKVALFTYEYRSVIDSSLQTIKIDISLKWELQKTPQIHIVQSLYRDKILEENIFTHHTISCIDLQEALAEKIRAALTRQTPAIRDFFDIWYVKELSDFDFTDPEFLRLVRIKIAEVGYSYTGEWSYDILEKQVETDLKPVLHTDYDFSLREIYNFILTFKK